MFRNSLRSSLWASAVVIVVSTGVGYFSSDRDAKGLLHGALLGAGLALALTLHLIMRTLNGRTPESRSRELSRQSIERQRIERAAAATFTDTISLAVVGCFVAFSTKDLQVAQLVLALVIVAAGIDFAIRSIALIRRGGDG